ncbi:2-oxoglutarate oxidoreductase [Alicyclobacillaceae bacterium I2511]|nr:2-oxoglutarate oxidoreductase [Alicyclobacillaceae bacterium I2511]
MRVLFEKTQALTDVPFHYCPGCTHGIVQRVIGEILEELQLLEKTVGVTGVGCGGFSEQYFNVDFQGSAHGRAPAVATGIKRAHPELIVFTYQGDGDMVSIGMAEAIHAAARGEKITAFLVNNSNYGMTGGQMAPTTLIGQKTSTSPYGRQSEESGYPVDLPALLCNLKGAAYVATVSVDTPANVLKAKRAVRLAFKAQIEGLGFSLVQFLSTCPTNWGLNPVDSIEWMQEHMFPEFQMGELKCPETFRR